MDLPQYAGNLAEQRHQYAPTRATGSTFEIQNSLAILQPQLQQSLPRQTQKRWAAKVKTGCLTCRRRRIKCDETKPACKRCTKFAYRCEGYDHTNNGSLNWNAEAAKRLICSPKLPLSNSNDRISNILVHFLESDCPGYSINPWRPFLIRQIPQRMGHSETFDASVATFACLLETTLHLPSPFQQPSRKSLQLYSTSIKALQKALTNPDTRYHSSTLYSAYTLEQCHTWMSRSAHMRGHSAGLLHLMNVILLQKPEDDFLLRLSHAVEADLCLVAFYNPDIQLFPWIETLLQTTERSAPDWPGNMKVKPPGFDLKWFSSFPDLIRYPKRNKQQVQSAYDYILDQFLHAKSYIKAMKAEPDWTAIKACSMNEAYGAFITMGCILNAFLRSFNPDNMLLHEQKRVFCASAVTLAKGAMEERPLAGHHIPEALLAAWCVADNAEGDIKARLRQLLEDYRETFAMARVIQNYATWQEVPTQLQEIPWMALSERRSASQACGAPAIEGLTQYCCIL